MVMARSRRSSAFTSVLMTSGSHNISPIFWRGLSEPYGFWNTICTLRRMSGVSASAAMSTLRPSISSSPDVAGSISVMMRASVDLPQPLSPTMASVLPFSTLNETPLTA
jgi:hypothetical protein